MKLVCYSTLKSENEQIGWHRVGENIAYFANGIRKSSKLQKSLYTLKFSHTFEYDMDTVYFAYSYPYTYSQLNEFLNKLESNENIREYFTRKTLCRTIAGNKCEYLTITSPKSKNENGKRPKKAVCLTARVHPGESVGSWMMHGIIEFLTDEKDPEAIALRDNIIFKIVPMLNPDGVINGNYRCSLAGCDLNRRWNKPSKVFF